LRSLRVLETLVCSLNLLSQFGHGIRTHDSYDRNAACSELLDINGGHRTILKLTAKSSSVEKELSIKTTNGVDVPLPSIEELHTHNINLYKYSPSLPVKASTDKAFRKTERNGLCELR